MRRLMLIIVAALVVATAALGLNAMRFASQQLPAPPPAPDTLPPLVAAGQLAAAVTFATVSYDDPRQVDAAAFAGLHRHFRRTYPQLFAVAETTAVGMGSLLLRWPGQRPDLPPILLLAHIDVVPVPAETLEQWDQPPFAGTISDGYVWGRGTIDDKLSAVAILAAADHLVRQGHRPYRDVWIALGHDEEIGGREGAVAMAAQLVARGVKPAWILDEGQAVLDGVLPDLARPVAMIGVAEKGYVTFRLTATAPAGHSSRPPSTQAVGVLAVALDRLAKQPLPARLVEPTRTFLRWLAPESSGLRRLALANHGLLEPLLLMQFVQDPSTAALVRTTTALTVLDAGSKENILPSRAQALVNLRILPGQTIADVQAAVERTVADPRIHVTRASAFGSEPSPVAPVDGPAFAVLHRTIRETFPEALVMPALVIGATDARHYVGLTPNVYRFAPIQLGAEDLGRFHGIDERVTIENVARAVTFYERLLVNATN